MPIPCGCGVRSQIHHVSLPDPPPASPFLWKSSQNHHFLPYPLKMMVPFIKPYQTYIKLDNFECFSVVPYIKPISNQHPPTLDPALRVANPTKCQNQPPNSLQGTITHATTKNNNHDNYFTSSYPHNDIYTFCCWQIFWHSIWHTFWHFIWHIFWHSIWPLRSSSAH